MKNFPLDLILRASVLFIALVVVGLFHKISTLEQYSKAAYKDGFEAGSKTVNCDDKSESAFNDGVMDGLKRAKTMCGITVKRSGE